MFLADPLFWFTLCMILVVVELLGSHKLYSMFFSFGALITAFLAFIASDAYLLVPAFFMISLLLSLIINPHSKVKHIEKNSQIIPLKRG